MKFFVRIRVTNLHDDIINTNLLELSYSRYLQRSYYSVKESFMKYEKNDGSEENSNLECSSMQGESVRNSLILVQVRVKTFTQFFTKFIKPVFNLKGKYQRNMTKTSS